ncbi:MAG: tetratricopeptide repeat protein [Nitrospirota bacterium]
MRKDRRFTSAILVGVAILLILPTISFAEIKTFIKEYTYTASDIDSKVSSRAIALEQVKRALLEQLGTYLISETEIKNYQMTKDQITTLTAGIISAEVIDEKWDGRSYYLKARIAAEPTEVAKSVDALRYDKQKTKELEEFKNRAETAMREVERLKKELDSVKVDSRKQKDYDIAIKDLSATDWFKKGYALYSTGNFRSAIEAYNKSIELNPQETTVYSNRGIAYARMGNAQQAISDYNKAIELNPRNADAYNNRGKVYAKSGVTHEAFKDLNKAIELNPQYATAYYNRGTIYAGLGNNQEAISDFNRAIELYPRYASAYCNRGYVYDELGDTQQAIKDYDKAIELNPRDTIPYNNRGQVYAKLGNTNKAMDDYNKAIELNPQDAESYYNKSCLLSLVKYAQEACKYLKKAIDLGYSKWEDIKKDKDLDNIRRSSCYGEIMAGK